MDELRKMARLRLRTGCEDDPPAGLCKYCTMDRNLCRAVLALADVVESIDVPTTEAEATGYIGREYEVAARALDRVLAELGKVTP